MDYQSLGAAISAVILAIGGVATGFYTGRNNRRKDESQARLDLEKSKLERDKTEEEIARARYEDLFRENVELRKAIRKDGIDFETQIRRARRYGQRGWDLARYHFRMLGMLEHLLNNIFQYAESTTMTVEFLRTAIRDTRTRYQAIGIPTTLEGPMPPDDSEDEMAE